MKFRKTSLAVAVSLALTACGGGGGGGGGGALGSRGGFTYDAYLERVGTIKPLEGASATGSRTSLIVQDIDGANGEELILAGRANLPEGTTPGQWYDYEISIWGWQGGTLVDQSNQWFGVLDRSVVGVEDQVMFGDFDGDGHRDLYAGPYTDISSVTAGQNGANTGAIFFNSGASSFDQRADINLGPTVSAHGSTIADINGDGIDDVWSTAGATSKVILGDAGRNLQYLDVAGMPQAGGSGVAVADFTAVGVKSVIFVDQGSAPNYNNLYTYNIDLANNRVDLTFVSALPTPRFMLPKWAGFGFGAGSHDVRVLADIHFRSGRTASSQAVVSDAVVFSRPNQYANGQWPEYQEAQFLVNDGTGNFTDVTDTVLKGWVSQGSASYNQVFKDVNNDGRLDIIVPGNSWDNNQGSQILIWNAAANAWGFEYQSSYNVTLTGAQDNALAAERAINATAGPGGSGVALLQDPAGNYYVATAINFESGGSQRRAIYMTPLNSLTPAATVAALKTNWPWLTDAQVNSILAQSTTTYFGLNLLDPAMALDPKGALALPAQAGPRPISGSIAGLALNGMADSLVVKDAFDRSYKMDFGATKTEMFNVWANTLDQKDDASRSAVLVPDIRYAETKGLRYGANPDNTSQIFGMPDIAITDSLKASWQFTNLPYSPWLQISGSWGQVRGSSTMETTLAWQQKGVRIRSGMMYSATHIDPGLVTKVNPITALWGDVTYQSQGWTAGAGILPYIVSGSAELTLPTSVDRAGKVRYTNYTAQFENPMVGFARLGYQANLAKRVSMQATGMISTQNSHAVKMEIKSTW